jgi:hypothetical protein
LLSSAEKGVSDRDLQVEYLTGESAEAVRREYGVADGFEALLVGRDRGVKLRSPEPVTPEELFGRIDEMPMRRREMREREEQDGV